MGLIRCPDCGKDVSTSALTCPNCGRPIEIARQQKANRSCLLVGCGLPVVLALIAIVIGLCADAAKTPEERAADSLATLESTCSSNCVVRAPTGGESVVLAVSKSALDEMLSAGSDRAIAVMVLDGSAFLVPQNTSVSIVDRGFLVRKVLVLEGPMAGRTGWTPKEWVVGAR